MGTTSREFAIKELKYHLGLGHEVIYRAVGGFECTVCHVGCVGSEIGDLTNVLRNMPKGESVDKYTFVMEDKNYVVWARDLNQALIGFEKSTFSGLELVAIIITRKSEN